ncbi:unnamed protein product [Rotaria socialis]|uniref:Transposase n=1 Tax=Rotaria socialis TaxID=392032 RepID=A0A820X5X0_9BILA|nr:unnamed protein product [Rotaria socialis]CAF4533261.1 unnamed protein product [Rotaria socialis]
MGRVKVPLNKKIEIKALLEFGITQRRIATDLGISKNRICNVSKKLKENLLLSNAPCQGPKKASTPIDDRNLLRLCKKYRTKSSQILSSELMLSNEADQSFNFVPKVQGGGGSISVWGCMAGGARGPLVIYSGKVDGRAYVSIIEEALPSFIENGFGSSNKNWMFMHDNAPSHQSKYTMK